MADRIILNCEFPLKNGGRLPEFFTSHRGEEEPQLRCKSTFWFGESGSEETILDLTPSDHESGTPKPTWCNKKCLYNGSVNPDAEVQPYKREKSLLERRRDNLKNMIYFAEGEFDIGL